ncbi:hypothetical protein SCP_0603520 [Sparassis crispa]|uniref:Uncharacterized protein n=1 Tax=Sparassis crispa TaxID=139825 RepID=A0A401GQ73_9APHY|nr:hypothetical protein SCP_0603520 [Sparassis crispa]GBE84373.1 hypothetical protein SCP_0603520 [Sparassis crispa]
MEHALWRLFAPPSPPHLRCLCYLLVIPPVLGVHVRIILAFRICITVELTGTDIVIIALSSIIAVVMSSVIVIIVCTLSGQCRLRRLTVGILLVTDSGYTMEHAPWRLVAPPSPPHLSSIDVIALSSIVIVIMSTIDTVMLSSIVIVVLSINAMFTLALVLSLTVLMVTSAFVLLRHTSALRLHKVKFPVRWGEDDYTIIVIIILF